MCEFSACVAFNKATNGHTDIKQEMGKTLCSVSLLKIVKNEFGNDNILHMSKATITHSTRPLPLMSPLSSVSGDGHCPGVPSLLLRTGRRWSLSRRTQPPSPYREAMVTVQAYPVSFSVQGGDDHCLGVPSLFLRTGRRWSLSRRTYAASFSVERSDGHCPGVPSLFLRTGRRWSLSRRT